MSPSSGRVDPTEPPAQGAATGAPYFSGRLGSGQQQQLYTVAGLLELFSLWLYTVPQWLDTEPVWLYEKNPVLARNIYQHIA